MLKLLSFVGLDARTLLQQVVQLARTERSYELEFSVLYSADRAGRYKRYPFLEECQLIVDYLGDYGIKVGVHLCGSEAIRDYLAGGEVHSLLKGGGRVQLNYKASSHNELDLLKAILEVKSSHEGNVILQVNKTKKAMLEQINASFPEGLNCVDLLYDSSGGFGRTLTNPQPVVQSPSGAAYFTGYAGGIDADNVADINTSVNQIADGDYYLDMESGVRIDDWFSLAQCQRVIHALNQTMPT